MKKHRLTRYRHRFRPWYDAKKKEALDDARVWLQHSISLAEMSTLGLISAHEYAQALGLP